METRDMNNELVFLCHSPNHPIKYPAGQIYCFPGHPYNTISLGDLKFYVDFQKVTSEPLEHFFFSTLKVILGDQPT